MLLAAAAVAALQATEGGTDVLGGEGMAQVHTQLAIAEAAEVGDAGGDRRGAAQWHAQAGHGGHLAVEAVAAALVAAATLQEPLHAAVGPVAALVERRVLAAHQLAIFVDAQGDGVVAEREPAGVELVDAGRQVEGLQQALAIEGVHPCIARQQHRQWQCLHGGIGIHVGLGGAYAQAGEAIHRQHAETEGAALRAGQVAAVHAPGLQIMLLAQVMAVIGVVELELIAAAATTVLLAVEVPVHGDVAALQHAQRACALGGQRLVAAATAEIEGLLVQECVLGIAADLMEAVGGGLGRDPLAGDEQAHRAFAFVVQGTHGMRVLGGIEIAAAGTAAAIAAGKMAVARQGLRQRGQQRGLRLGGKIQRLQHARGVFQLHVFQSHAHRRKPGRASEQAHIELFDLAFNQILEAGRNAACRDQGHGQRQGERDRQPSDGRYRNFHGCHA